MLQNIKMPSAGSLKIDSIAEEAKVEVDLGAEKWLQDILVKFVDKFILCVNEHKHIQDAVAELLPGELGKHAISGVAKLITVAYTTTKDDDEVFVGMKNLVKSQNIAFNPELFENDVKRLADPSFDKDMVISIQLALSSILEYLALEVLETARKISSKVSLQTIKKAVANDPELKKVLSESKGTQISSPKESPKYVINPVTKKRISVSGAVFKALTKTQQAQALGSVAQKSPKATPKKTAKSKKAPKGEWSEWDMKEYNNELNTHANQYGQMKSSPDYSVYFDYHGVGGFHLTQSKVSKLKGVCLWTEKKGDKVVIHSKGTLPIHILDCALEEWFKNPDYLLNAVSAVIFEGVGPSDDQIRKTFPRKNFKYLIDNNYLWGEFYFTLGNLALRACTFTSEELVVDDLY